jgi:sulfotransferase
MIFYNSSMPRSGSTLLQNILAQNPEVHSTPTDGFLELIYGARVNFTNNAEFKAQDSEQMLAAWQGFCREGLKGYAAGLSDKPNTCIKSRGIGEQFSWFSSFLGEDPKILCMVRDAKSILSSMEKLYRADPNSAHQIHNPSEMRGLTTEGRVQQWLSGPPVGLALQRFQDMARQGTETKCLFIRYEDLVENPGREMDQVYDYLGLERFSHNFQNVEQVTQEDDAVFGMAPGLHDISKVVKAPTPDHNEILGEELCQNIDNTCAGYQRAYGYIPSTVGIQ